MVPVPLFALSLLFTPVADASCPAEQLVPEVEVVANREQPTFSYTSSSADLNHLGSNAYVPQGAQGPSWHKSGLTQSQINIADTVNNRTRTYSNGLKCIYIDKIVLTVTITPTVWVANDYPPGTCMYNAVKEHEMKHVHAEQAVLTTHTGRLRTAIENVGRYRTVFGPNSEMVVNGQYETFLKQVKDTVQNEFTVYQYDEAKAQQAIDTLQEYNRISNLCKDQLREIAARGQ